VSEADFRQLLPFHREVGRRRTVLWQKKRLGKALAEDRLDWEDRASRVTPRPEASGKWHATVPGNVLRADALGQLFAEIVNVFHAYHPAVLESLSHHRGRTRRFIARTREGVHGGQLDLGIIRARSGWWVRGCVSARDVRRAFEALCGEAKLRFGRDIQSPKDVA
jgi:hypothetical protein